MSAELSSWSDGPTKSAIIDFVARVTDDGGPDFVEPAARVAVFDNDGTLWCEKPMPIQLDFTVRRLGELARKDPTPAGSATVQGGVRERPALDGRRHGQALPGRRQRPEAVDGRDHLRVRDGDRDRVRRSGEGLLRRGQPPDAEQVVPRLRLRCPWWSCCGIWRTHGFATYIASGGDRDFMRPVAGDLYGIPPERVIGSALGLTFRSEGGRTSLLYKAAMDFFDDGPEKPVRIWSRIGRRPILACGNSNGDVPMLSYVADGPALRLLILHDDAEREFDYVAGADQALETARAAGLDRGEHQGRLGHRLRLSWSMIDDRSEPAGDRLLDHLQAIPAQTFRMGSDRHYRGGGPVARRGGRRLLAWSLTRSPTGSSPGSCRRPAIARWRSDRWIPADFPGAPAENLQPGLDGVRPAPPARWISGT